jgi:Fe-S-cluster containining protein
LRQQLADYAKEAPCPFLVDDACAIHPMRPMTCRQFNVFDKVCDEREDAFYSRRQDVLKPPKTSAEKAFFAVLPFYGMRNRGERRQAVKKGIQHALARVLQEQDWPKLAARMLAFDRANRTVS